MVSVTTASRLQSRSSTYIRGLSLRYCSRQLGLRQRHTKIQLNPVHFEYLNNEDPDEMPHIALCVDKKLR